MSCHVKSFGGGDDTVGNPHRAQIVQFELFELIPLLKLDKQLPVERFEATVSQSTVPSSIRYYTVLYYAILYYTILYYTILYYTILYYTILYY